MKTKNLLLIMPLVLLMATWVIGQGCGSKSNPSTPAAATATPTPTVTKTPTQTPTKSPTLTSTVTLTNTLTSTVTYSPTPTNTNTPTLTNTLTNTPTVTSTNTPCYVAPTMTYIFNSGNGLQGWSVVKSNISASTAFVAVPTFTGNTQSLQVSGVVSNTQNFFFEYDSPCYMNLTNMQINYRIYVASPLGTSGNYAYQLYDQALVAETWEDSGWQTTGLTADQWVTLSYTPAFGQGAGAATQVTDFGIHLFYEGSGTSVPVTFYVDSVWLTSTAVFTPTPTLTSTPTVSTANSLYMTSSSSLTGWVVVPNDASVTISPLTWESGIDSGLTSSTGSLGVTCAWSATGQNCYMQYAFSSPQNWTTLNLTGIIATIYTNPLIQSQDSGWSNWPYGKVAIWSGAGSAYEDGADTNLTDTTNHWYQLNFQPTFSGGDPTQVQQIGVWVATNGPDNYQTDTFYLDSMQLY